ncbi:MAG TPA: AI-2E family transporter [Candidatus Angelobacter sp.]
MPVKLFDKRTAQALFTALVFALALLFLYSAWRAILAFLFAIFFAYLLEAPVYRLQLWFRGRRGPAIAVVYLVSAGALTILFSLAGPPVIHEAQTLAQQAPALANNIASGNVVRQLGAQHGWSHDTIEHLNDFVRDHRDEVLAATQNFIVGAVRRVQNTWWLFLVPILAIFFLKDGRRIAEALINTVEDDANRMVVAATVEEMNTMLGHYIRAQLLFAAIAMVVVTFVLSIMKVPYAIALGPAAGALEFIPVVGPVIGGLAVMVVAFTAGYGHLWGLLIFLLLWRVVQDYLTSPRIMGSTLELHPLTVLFGVFAGGEVAGVIGVFLSIPVLATLRILWRAWQRVRKPVNLSATGGK